MSESWRQIAAVLPIFVAATAAAQQDTPPPTFRAGTKLVQIDVVARSKGSPVSGLTRDDFTVFDNGMPQKIAFFTVRSGAAPANVQAPDAPSLAPGDLAGSGLP